MICRSLSASRVEEKVSLSETYCSTQDTEQNLACFLFEITIQWWVSNRQYIRHTVWGNLNLLSGARTTEHFREEGTHPCVLCLVCYNRDLIGSVWSVRIVLCECQNRLCTAVLPTGGAYVWGRLVVGWIDAVESCSGWGIQVEEQSKELDPLSSIQHTCIEDRRASECAGGPEAGTRLESAMKPVMTWIGLSWQRAGKLA